MNKSVQKPNVYDNQLKRLAVCSDLRVYSAYHLHHLLTNCASPALTRLFQAVPCFMMCPFFIQKVSVKTILTASSLSPPFSSSWFLFLDNQHFAAAKQPLMPTSMSTSAIGTKLHLSPYAESALPVIVTGK